MNNIIKSKYAYIWSNPALIQEAVDNSESVSDVLRYLNIKVLNNNYYSLKRYCLLYNIELPVFDNSKATKNAIKSNAKRRDEPLEVIFSLREKRIDGGRLKKLLIKHFNFKNECCECHIGPEWNGKPLTLQLDHIDGNRNNNVIDNLRIMCPNCHSQTETHSRAKSIIL